MPRIMVAAVVMRRDEMLFVRGRGEQEWRLPSGPLLDSDESVEAAIERVLKEQYGVRKQLEEPAFISTAYEWHGDETSTLHNLFAVAPASKLRPSGGVEQRWLKQRDLDSTPAPEWLKSALMEEADAGELAALEGLLALTQPGGLAGVGPPGLLLPPGVRPPPGGLPPALAAMGQALAGGLKLPDLPPLPPVYVITGPAGTGKTAVANELCRRFPKSAQIDMDALLHMVVSGYVRPGHGESDPEERERQSHLSHENASALALNFMDAGFTPVIHGVFETEADLTSLLSHLLADDETTEMHVITLLPDAATLKERDQGRPEAERMGARSEELHKIFQRNREKRGLRLDTSAMSVAHTVDRILERAGETRVRAEEVPAV